MGQHRLIAMFVLLALFAAGCNTSSTSSTQTPTRISPTQTFTPSITSTATATFTPTVTPTPTMTFTPSPTAIAGGNGNLLLSCIETNEVKDLGKLFIYEIATDTIIPVNSDTLQSKEILAASPSGQVILWRSCPRGVGCTRFISNSTLSINKAFGPDRNTNYLTYLFVSDNLLIYWTYTNDSLGHSRASNLYLLDITSNEKTLLIENENEDHYFGDSYLSPTGEFVAFDYYFEPYGTEAITEIIDVSNHRILEYQLHGNNPNWVTKDGLMYYDTKLGKYVLINIITGKMEEYEKIAPQISPDGKWLAYSARTSKGIQIIIENILEETTITIPDSSFYSARVQKWDPNGKKIIFSIFPTRSDQQIRIYDTESGTSNLLIEVDTNESGGFADISWSHDNQWYTISIQKLIYVIDDEPGIFIGNAFDYYICNNNSCKLLEHPNTTYCSMAIWTDE